VEDGPSPSAWACSASGSLASWSVPRSAVWGSPSNSRSRASSSSSMCWWSACQSLYVHMCEWCLLDARGKDVAV
jgi:hypothetical protein